MSILIGASPNLYAQNDLTINNNTGCTYTVDVEFEDGSGNCMSVTGVTIPASPTTTYIANPFTPPSGTAQFIIGIDCNPCPTTPLPVGPSTNACNANAYPNPVYYVCGSCAPNNVRYTWTPAGGGGNAVLDIDPL